jgi:flagellar biosynthesis/type III secretory pathway protein FliH
MMSADESENKSQKKNTGLDVDLHPEYVQASWEIVGSAPSAPVFDSAKVRVERPPDVGNQAFVQGVVVDAGISGSRVLFDPDQYLKRVAVDQVAQADDSVETPAVISMSEQELEDMLNSARAQAYEEARSEYEDELRTQLACVARNWEEVFADMKDQMALGIQNIEQQMLRFSVDVLRHFIRELSTGNEALLRSVVAEAFELVDPKAIVEVSLSEADKALFDCLPDLVALQEKYNFSVRAEPSVTTGCIVRTDFEELDFDVQASFERSVRNIFGSQG